MNTSLKSKEDKNSIRFTLHGISGTGKIGVLIFGAVMIVGIIATSALIAFNKINPSALPSFHQAD